MYYETYEYVSYLRQSGGITILIIHKHIYFTRELDSNWYYYSVSKNISEW